MPDYTGKESVRIATFRCNLCLTTILYLGRYGQEREVFCKVYYTPVSIEERLLLWRHRFESKDVPMDTDETTIFAPMRGVQHEDQDEDLAARQTEFLLNLRHPTSDDP